MTDDASIFGFPVKTSDQLPEGVVVGLSPARREGALRATIVRADGVPGLFDVELEDGRQLRDLTVGQVSQAIGEMGLVPWE
jgi:hypothetical protein